MILYKFLSLSGRCFSKYIIRVQLRGVVLIFLPFFSPKAVRMATRDVIREFAEDGVRYLELRSTPRAVQNRMTRKGSHRPQS